MKRHRAISALPLPPDVRVKRDGFGRYKVIKNGRLVGMSKGRTAKDGEELLARHVKRSRNDGTD